MEWLLIPAALVVFYLIYLAAKAAAKRAQERRDALLALATRRGWSFAPGEDSSIKAELSEFSAFQQGHSHYGYNTLRGHLRINDRQWDVSAGDYTYKVTVSTGKTTTTVTHVFSYIVADCPFPSVPDLVVRRENFLDRIGAAFGMPDINFESAEFSRAFHVKGPDRKFAFSLIHPQMIEFLLASNPPPIELSEARVLFAMNDDVWTPGEFDAKIVFAEKFLGLWPQYLQDDLEARS